MVILEIYLDCFMKINFENKYLIKLIQIKMRFEN